jgi:hypothetical protein
MPIAQCLECQIFPGAIHSPKALPVTDSPVEINPGMSPKSQNLPLIIPFKFLPPDINIIALHKYRLQPGPPSYISQARQYIWRRMADGDT